MSYVESHIWRELLRRENKDEPRVTLSEAGHRLAPSEGQKENKADWRRKWLKGQNSARWSRDLATVFGLAVFALLLVFLFNVNPVYAPEPDYLCHGDNEQCPGGGGGGGTPPPPSHIIEGVVYDYDTSLRVGSGITLYLNINYATFTTTTDSIGNFKFENAGLNPNTWYKITVNGIDYKLGSYLDDVHWGQRAVWTLTNSNAWAFKAIFLQKAAVVNVPSAALFSNTQYATLYYGTQTSSGFSHSLSFSVPIIGANVGYKTSESVTYTALFWSSPNHAQYINRPYYAPTYLDDTLGNIVSGVAQAVEYSDWGGLTTNEYLDKNNLPTPEYVDFPVPPGGKDWTYQEQGSTTWSADLNVPFAILYQAFGKVIKLDTAVTRTSGTTTWVRYRIENPTQNDIYFRVYTRGSNPDLNNGIGGMELHVWQI